MKNRTTLLILLLAIPGLFQSCDEECMSRPESLAGINFHTIIDGIDRNEVVDGLTVYGLERQDSLLYSSRNLRSVNLPLNGLLRESAFVMVFGETADTVWLSYDVVPWFLSEECGFILNFELLGARHTINMIDSVVIIINEISTFDDTNIRIYH
jgi:hypothetical protein